MPRLRHRTVVANCVRCGRLPRAVGETWLCGPCSQDGQAYAEAIEAVEHGANVRERRRWIIAERHWAGGWPAMRE